MKKNLGFTLIELMVVFSIITFLSSVVLASTKTARLKAQDSKIAEDMRQFGLASQLYFDNNNAYPSFVFSGSNNYLATDRFVSDIFSIEKFNIFSTKKAEAAYSLKCDQFNNAAANLVAGKYLSSIPKHPRDNGSDVCYKAFRAGDGSYFTAYAETSAKVTGAATLKKVGIILGNLSTTTLAKVYSDTGGEYPVAVGGGAISNMSLSADAIINSVNSNTASASSSLYTLTVNTTGNGTVSKNPNTSTYAPGASVVITATPSSGYVVNWAGCDYSYVNTCNVTMSTLNKTITATFVQGYTLAVMSTNQPSAMNYSFSPNGSSYTSSYGSTGYPSSSYFAPGSYVTIYMMSAPSGYNFTGFSNCSSSGGVSFYSGTYGSCSFSSFPSNNVYLYATFSPISISYPLYLIVNSGGSVSKSPNSTTYPYGTYVTLTATASADYVFAGWNGGGGTCSGGSSPTCSLNIYGTSTVYATFTYNPV